MDTVTWVLLGFIALLGGAYAIQVHLLHRTIDVLRQDLLEASCQHSWTTVSTSYRGPYKSFNASGFFDEDDFRSITEGVTTVTQRCEHCGKVDSKRHFGHVIVPGLTPTERKFS